MKKIYITLLALVLFVANNYAQVTLFSENFNSGTSTQFSLNTTDVGSNPGAINQWVINNNYAGGTGTASIYCSGFGTTFPAGITAGPVKNEPIGITGYPNSYYLHIDDTLARSIGILSADYTAADSQCVFSENTFVKMNTDVNTTGLNGVSLSFWWICNADSNSYGEVLYSTNSGSSWKTITTPITKYQFDTVWTQQTISLPAFDNNATLRFAFMWVNRVYTTGVYLDPPFSLDDISITYSTTGIQQAFEQSTSIYPNPTSGDVSIHSGENIKQVTVTNVVGQMVSSVTENSGAGADIMVHLPQASGMYFIHIVGDNGEMVSKVEKE